MPGGNGTGPNGMGSMTGRGAGYCAGNGMPGSMNPVIGRGSGFGAGRRGAFGGGRGRGFGFNAAGLAGRMSYGGSAAVSYHNPDPESVRQSLENRAEVLFSELEQIKKRLSEMKTETSKE